MRGSQPLFPSGQGLPRSGMLSRSALPTRLVFSTCLMFLRHGVQNNKMLIGTTPHNGIGANHFPSGRPMMLGTLRHGADGPLLSGREAHGAIGSLHRLRPLHRAHPSPRLRVAEQGKRCVHGRGKQFIDYVGEIANVTRDVASDRIHGETGKGGQLIVQFSKASRPSTNLEGSGAIRIRGAWWRVGFQTSLRLGRRTWRITSRPCLKRTVA